MNDIFAFEEQMANSAATRGKHGMRNYLEFKRRMME